MTSAVVRGVRAASIFAAAGLVACAPAPASTNDDRSQQHILALAQDVTDNWNEHDERLIALEARVAELEARASTPTDEAGSWIVWESETINANPQQYIVSPRPTQPMYAHSSQDECVTNAQRVAEANGGSGMAFVRAGMGQTTWVVLLRCLPKGVDPRG